MWGWSPEPSPFQTGALVRQLRTMNICYMCTLCVMMCMHYCMCLYTLYIQRKTAVKEGGEGDGKAAEEKLKRLRKRNAELVAQTRQLDDKTKSLKLENEQLVNIPSSLFLLPSPPPSLSLLPSSSFPLPPFPVPPTIPSHSLYFSYFPSLALTSLSLSLVLPPSLPCLSFPSFLPSSRSTLYMYMYMYVHCTTTCTTTSFLPLVVQHVHCTCTCTCMYTVQLRVCTVYNYMYMYIYVQCTCTCVFPSES